MPNRIFISERQCCHSEDFFCTAVTVDGGIQHVMACSLICGYYLNFDPIRAGKIQEAEVPRNPEWDAWRLNTVAFVYIERVVDKMPPKLSTHT